MTEAQGPTVANRYLLIQLAGLYDAGLLQGVRGEGGRWLTLECSAPIRSDQEEDGAKWVKNLLGKKKRHSGRP